VLLSQPCDNGSALNFSIKVKSNMYGWAEVIEIIDRQFEEHEKNPAAA
jgi:hypothetical protein